MKHIILNYYIITGIVLSSAYAGDPVDLQRFKETGSCIGGDLSGFYLSDIINDLQFLHPDIVINLEHAHLHKTNLQYANLDYARLAYANFSKANLSQASLDHANLQNANLTRAQCEGTTFNHANLTQAIMSGTFILDGDLSYAQIIDAQLQGAAFYKCCLIGADFSRSNLLYTGFNESIFDGSTIFADVQNAVQAVWKDTPYDSLYNWKIKLFGLWKLPLRISVPFAPKQTGR